MLCWSFAVLNDGDHRFLRGSLNEITIWMGCLCSSGTVHLKSTSQLRQTVEYVMHFLKNLFCAVGRNFQSTSHLCHLQETLRRNKISVLDPHLVWIVQSLPVSLYELLGWPLCLHILSWSQQEWKGSNIFGWQLSMTWRSLWILVHLWEANVICLHLRTGSYSSSKVFLCGTASLISWLIAHIFAITVLSLLPPQSICAQSLRKKDNFLLIRGQGEGFTEKADSHNMHTSLRHFSKIWLRVQVNQRKVKR